MDKLTLKWFRNNLPRGFSLQESPNFSLNFPKKITYTADLAIMDNQDYAYLLFDGRSFTSQEFEAIIPTCLLLLQLAKCTRAIILYGKTEEFLTLDSKTIRTLPLQKNFTKDQGEDFLDSLFDE
jgi:hypothetical protein